MQAKKRYILVFVSCAFLAYCYFGGYRLKRARVPFSPSTNRQHEQIAVPSNLPSFLSSIECNGIDDIASNTDGNPNGRSIISIAQHGYSVSNDDAFRQGSQISSATVQTNTKFKGMYDSIVTRNLVGI